MNRRKTIEEFKSEVADQTGVDYKVLGEYVTNRTKILLLHKTCAKEFTMRPDEFLRGKRCPHCYRNKLLTTAEFTEYVKQNYGNEYDVLGEYKNNRTPILLKHNVCGKEFKCRPDNFKSGKNCSNCNNSHGELKILKFLDSRKIHYVKEYTFDDCVFINPLRFDFSVLTESKKVSAVVEYDGEQHFRVVKYFGGAEGFEERIRNDTIKDKYCSDNRIPLIRIPYWEYDNIDEILTQKLLPLLAP